MNLFPIEKASVQYVTCPCGRVLHVDQRGKAHCEVCETVHTVSVETTRKEGDKE